MGTKPTFTPVFESYAACRLRYAILVGGAGSGKSFSAALKLIGRACTEPGARFLVVRKVGRTLKRSCFQLCKDLISQMGLSKDFKAVSTELRIEHKVTGAQLLFTGIDDPDKLKSIQGISTIWVEEATEITDADFRQLELRLRGDTPGYKQITCTCNPTSDQSWVYKRFADRGLPRRADVYHLHTTARDNPHIDPDYLDVLETSMRDDEHFYRVYTLGMWGTEVKKDLFYKKFDTRRHIVPAQAPDPELPLRISFDFNVQPYITATVWQVRGLEARQVSEVCLEGPRNTVQDLAAELLRRFGPSWPAGAQIYGDPAGYKRDSGARFTYFRQLEAGLSPWGAEVKAARQPPSVAIRGQWINRILSAEWDGIRIRIGDNCKKTLLDYATVREDPGSTKVKAKTKDHRNGATYEPYGHCSDANDYLLCTLFSDSYKQFKNGDRGQPLMLALPAAPV